MEWVVVANPFLQCLNLKEKKDGGEISMMEIEFCWSIAEDRFLH